jgi:hypothetical protein
MTFLKRVGTFFGTYFGEWKDILSGSTESSGWSLAARVPRT